MSIVDHTETHDRLVSLLLKCKLHGNAIFVRELIDDKWKSVPIDSLSPTNQAKHEATWIIEHMLHAGWMAPQ